MERGFPNADVFGVHLVPKMLVKSVAQLAGLYISSLKKMCPSSGPLVLLGCDIAGAIAYEMAHQLTRNGDDVQRLVLIGRPFFDERCFASPEADALAIMKSEKTSDKQKMIEVWKTISKLCFSYAKKKSSLLPCQSLLFLDPKFMVDGMDEILQQTLFKHSATSEYDPSSVLAALIEPFSSSLLRRSSRRYICDTNFFIINFFWGCFREVVAMRALSELLQLSGSQHHARLEQSISQSRHGLAVSSIGLRASSVLGVSQLQVLFVKN